MGPSLLEIVFSVTLKQQSLRYMYPHKYEVCNTP